jgi:ribosomal protein L5
MNYSNFINIENLNRFDLINKFNYSNYYKAPKNMKIVLSCSIKEKEIENNVLFTQSMVLNEIIMGFKGFVNSYNIKTKGKSLHKYFFSFKQNIIKNNVLDFIYIYILFAIPNLNRKFLNLEQSIDKFGNLKIRIKDLTVFPGVGEQFFGWNNYFNFHLLLNTNNKIESNMLLRNLGF